MSIVEGEAKKRRARRNIQHAVLSAVGVTGIIAVALIAPNIFQAIPRLTGDTHKIGYRARTAAGRLAQKGFVQFVERRGKKYMEITAKGRKALELEQRTQELSAKKKRRWDKQYRLVMFDIPQRRKAKRDTLRRLVKRYGFLRLQNSVWVYPYDCEEIITLVKADMHFGKDVIYAVVESIENDAWIKDHFKLGR